MIVSFRGHLRLEVTVFRIINITTISDIHRNTHHFPLSGLDYSVCVITPYDVFPIAE
jgi:hypothetical protein